MTNSIPAAMIIMVDRREKTKAVMMRPSLVDCQLVSHVSIDKLEVCSVLSQHLDLTFL